MAEPYYRIGTAKSELETILYDMTQLNIDLEAAAARHAGKGEEALATISDIKRSHRFPFRTTFSPVVCSANHFLSNSNSSNRRFTIEYGGEFSARMYQAIDFSAGTVEAVTTGDSVLWAYCDNFIASFIDNIAYKVSTDILYEFPGHMYYIWYTLLAPMASRPALMRCLRECCWEFKWMQGESAKNLTNQYNRTTAGNVLTLQHPYSPLQSFETTHGAFTAYVPYNLFTLCTVRNAYPVVSTFSLNRSLEYNFNPLINCINVWAGVSGSSPDSGLVDPTATNPTTGIFTWVTTPTVTGTRLIVENFVVQKELQRMLALNAHGFLIRQYFSDVETLYEKSGRELSVTKIIESIYLLCRHTRNVMHTPYPSTTTEVTLTGGAVSEYHAIDPFFMPVDEKPINGVSLAARGQVFYKDLDWDEISAVNQYLYSTPFNSTSSGHCLGVLTFAHFYNQDEHTGSYNSGYGPNLRLSWRQQAFTSTDTGILNTVIQGLNMVLFYRGALTIRYC